MNIALIVAAGSGTRMGTDIPKQFLLVNDKPLLIYTIEAFNQNEDIDAIYIITSEDYILKVQAWCVAYKLNKVKDIVMGGNSRQESVYRGLKSIKANKDDCILIHDGTRPLVSQDIINNNISASKKYDAIDTAIKASDTIINSKDGEIINTIPARNELYQSQTPQTFKYDLILKAHEAALSGQIQDATDDARLIMALGKEVHLVEGNKQNFKITTTDDLKLLKALLSINQ